jgi:hypothetical protein
MNIIYYIVIVNYYTRIRLQVRVGQPHACCRL